MHRRHARLVSRPAPCGSGWIAALERKNTEVGLQQRDRRDAHRAGANLACPSNGVRVSATCLAQFRGDIECPGRPSAEIRRATELTSARRIEVDVSCVWHRKQGDDAGGGAGQPPIALDRQQSVRRAPPISDEDRPLCSSLLRASRVSIELPAGKSSDAHVWTLATAATAILQGGDCNHMPPRTGHPLQSERRNADAGDWQLNAEADVANELGYLQCAWRSSWTAACNFVGVDSIKPDSPGHLPRRDLSCLRS